MTIRVVEIPSPRIRTGFLVRENTDHIALAVKRIRERRLAEVEVEFREPALTSRGFEEVRL